MELLIHADDFGITLEQSKIILGLTSAGGGPLNSLSVMANSPQFESCMALLDDAPADLHIGVHLNFVEGACCADPRDVSLLVDEKGVFCLGYGGLLKSSFGAAGKELRRQVEIEARAQIVRVVERLPQVGTHLRLDGHQHTQLIPGVFDGICNLIEHDRLHVEYLRIPAEPTLPFLSPAVFGQVSPVNWIKHALLNILWMRDRRRWKDLYAQWGSDPRALFCGVAFSGAMTAERVGRVLPQLAHTACKQGRSLEVLFHPGRVARPQDCLNPNLPGFVAFSCGEGRDLEAAALRDPSLVQAFKEIRR